MNRFDDDDSDILGYPLSAYTPDDWAPRIGMIPPAYKTPEPTSKIHIAVKKIPARRIISLAEKPSYGRNKTIDFNNRK